MSDVPFVRALDKIKRAADHKDLKNDVVVLDRYEASALYMRLVELDFKLKSSKKA